MLDEQLRKRGITSRRVLEAMGRIPRERFMTEDVRDLAYADQAVAIDCGQTISQPYIVASMIDAAEVAPGMRVLEVGAGSGYMAAVMSRIAGQVFAIERHEALTRLAQARLDRLGYDNIRLKTGDGTKGWPEAAPFDAIIVAAAPESVPGPLLRQLKTGGRLVIPVGDRNSLQSLLVLTKRRDGGFDRSNVMPVFFVPMTGEAQREPPR